MNDKFLVSRKELQVIEKMLPEGEIRDKFKDCMFGIGFKLEIPDNYKRSEKETVTMYCDDGEGYLKIHRGVDGDIWFSLKTTPGTRSIRFRTSGSSIKFDLQSEVKTTLDYLMYLLEYGYEEDSIDHMKKIIGMRMRGEQ